MLRINNASPVANGEAAEDGTTLMTLPRELVTPHC